MKHSAKITTILLAMFFVTQLIALFVIAQYQPITSQVIGEDGNITNVTTYNLPYGMDPPQEVESQSAGSLIISLIISFTIAIVVIFILMKYHAATLLRLWFFLVVALAIGITFNSTILGIANSSLIAIILAIPLSFYKVFKHNMLLHNITELLVYPGVAAIFTVLILSWTDSPIFAIVVILLLISLYDMYAVWSAGFMQKMAKYQIEQLKFFTGFFIPYLGKKEKLKLLKAQKSKTKSSKLKKMKVNVAILGGGDVVFPAILAGTVFSIWGIIPAIIISVGATIALAGLFALSQKGKFYPAMPFITAGCLIALALAYLI